MTEPSLVNSDPLTRGQSINLTVDELLLRNGLVSLILHSRVILTLGN